MKNSRIVPAAWMAALVFTMAAESLSAAETVTYQYDALGRLKQTTKSGGPANGTQTTTTFDPVGNRVNQTTIGAPQNSPPP